MMLRRTLLRHDLALEAVAGHEQQASELMVRNLRVLPS
jgi:hypothetical protein